MRLGIFLPLALCAVSVGAPADRAEAWREIGGYAFDTAYERLRDSADREGRLGEAAALLNLQPRTAGNIERGAALLDAVMEGGSRDELGICAPSGRPRRWQTHRFEPRLDEAARRYRALLALGVDHPLVQQAAVRLTLLTLYSGPKDSAPADRVTAAEALGAGLSDPAAIRDHALLVGRACIYFELPLARAQGHLERALAAGIVNTPNRADVLVQLGEIARERGDAAGALKAYRAYLEENPRADRSAAVRRRIAEIEGTRAPR